MSAWTPLWQDYRYDARDRLEDDVDVDVAVIGAGIGGISTAWHLAGLGIRATVLEARTAGSGASGRNGGFLIAQAPRRSTTTRGGCSGTSWPGASMPRRSMRSRPCSRSPTRSARAGCSSGVAACGSPSIPPSAHLLDDVEQLHEDGFPAVLVTGDDLPPELQGPGRSGYVVPDDCSVQPSRWIRAFAEGAEQRGARIFEHTPVAAPIAARDGQAYVLQTPHGRVRAERVVVAADGALPILVPALGPHVRTKRLHMVATAPTDARIAPQLVYSRRGYEYHHQTHEGRVALGGYSDVDGEGSFTEREEPTPIVLDRLEQHLRDELGVHAPVTHRWVGLVGYGPSERPFAGLAPGADGLYVLGGYNGTGNLNGFVAGRIVAELVAHGSAPDADLYDTGRITAGRATSSRPSSRP